MKNEKENIGDFVEYHSKDFFSLNLTKIETKYMITIIEIGLLQF